VKDPGLPNSKGERRSASVGEVTEDKKICGISDPSRWIAIMGRERDEYTISARTPGKFST
jgi:hypothetical protein